MPVTVRPDRLVAGGEALARDGDGRVVFITGALPGELVDVEIDTAKKDYAKGRVVEVLEPSPVRESPSCAHRRAGCGGCDWMHLQPASQVGAKVEIVRESLRRIGHLDADLVDRLVHAGGTVSRFGYRTTIRVIGGPGGTVGYREQRGHRVVPITSCPIADSRLSRMLPMLDVDDGAELTLRTSVATGAVTAIWDHKHRNAIRGIPDDVHIGERAWLTERVAGHELRMSAPSFFQSGVQAAELLVGAVRRAAPELATARTAIDAYAGVGLFAATAMQHVGRVTLIESSKSACFDARHNLAGRDVEIVRGEVGRWKPAEATPAGGRVDVVVADPARPGLAKPGVSALVAPRPAVLVVVHCDPVSLARDTGLLAGAGYHPARVEVLELFPNTHHVETVTRFVPTVGGDPDREVAPPGSGHDAGHDASATTKPA